jgi:hypothetical protein
MTLLFVSRTVMRAPSARAEDAAIAAAATTDADRRAGIARMVYS